MRKWLVAVMAIGVLAAASTFAQEVKSVNVAGIINISVPAGGLKIVGINLDAFDPADATLFGILGGKLNPGGQFDPSTADKVIMWNGTSYDVYGIRADTGQFHDAADLGTWLGASVNPTILPGTGFWLKDAVGDGIELSLTGQAVQDAQMDIPIVNGLQFVCYPLSAEINVQSTSFAGTVGVGKGGAFDPSTADKIISWNGSAYDVYGLKDDNQWYNAADLGTWLGSPVDVTINLGVGFWYQHKLSGFTWSESNPYLSNL